MFLLVTMKCLRLRWCGKALRCYWKQRNRYPHQRGFVFTFNHPLLRVDGSHIKHCWLVDQRVFVNTRWIVKSYIVLKQLTVDIMVNGIDINVKINSLKRNLTENTIRSCLFFQTKKNTTNRFQLTHTFWGSPLDNAYQLSILNIIKLFG